MSELFGNRIRIDLADPHLVAAIFPGQPVDGHLGKMRDPPAIRTIDQHRPPGVVR